ncbi:hypothetical protein A3J43_00150 [Candidatus Uhrbacteria bacterium RIFCSPHIGHO2_12_FULL_54_23]|uniref:Uncharacterized protein n=2 Tax=Candidatus Uhriibacteriota TaxID=1752732 RepID=A0A1F7UFY1_9BACT|nr:MAG: hypothetical protein A3J43_00150 [Candidatus Uhrbacteria bacterium RIFCSPHIGHO2_12_FULL_54_23]OGL90075.1 MAG: hypothetical protein A3J36_01345 [Candidatus Uhrbacteria bacterium RIFCSPLOWO2_02_FULL_54_37]
MNLLFITRRIESVHPLAGFAASWVKEFAQQLSADGGRLDVITWQEGSAEGLSENVKVYASHGMREIGRIRHTRLIRLIRFIGLMVRLVPKSDVVFAHQHPIYAIIAAPFAKFFRKRLYLWYVHKHVDLKLRIATALCDGIVTASKESFRLKAHTPVSVVGHGIDTGYFKPAEDSSASIEFKIISVGRISPVKGHETLIDAMQIINRRSPHATLTIIGGPGLPAHQAYFEELQRLVREKGLAGVIEFAGPRAHADVVSVYQGADAFVNVSDTGSMDKAVLEACACGVPVVTSNEAFKEFLGAVDSHLYTEKRPAAVAAALERIIAMPLAARHQLGGILRAAVVRDHDLKRLVAKVLDVIQGDL